MSKKDEALKLGLEPVPSIIQMLGHCPECGAKAHHFTSPQPSKPHGFAGVTVWIGDATVTRIVTQVQIQHERVAGQSMKQTAQVCLDMLAAHGIKGDA